MPTLELFDAYPNGLLKDEKVRQMTSQVWTYGWSDHGSRENSGNVCFPQNNGNMYDILYINILLYDIIYELLMRCHPPPAFPKSERFDPGTVTPYISYIIIYYNAIEKL